MKIIDATDLIVGRIATAATKLALQGEKVVIVNCKNSIFTGKKKTIIEWYKAKRDRGEPMHGPFYPRRADRLVRRVVRGMLPYKQSRGRDAFKNVVCYVGMPKNLDMSQKFEVPEASASKLPTKNYMKLSDLLANN